jgi:hypothetical protein
MNFIRKFTGTIKLDDYVDAEGNLIHGAEIDTYVTYPEFIVATICEEME